MILFLFAIVVLLCMFNLRDLVTCLIGAVFVSTMIILALIGFAMFLRLFFA